MREILFRGKRVDNGEWVEGYYVHQYGADMIYIPDEVSGEYGFEYYHINPETIGQYTGLCDKNGKKIFEGDICQDEHCVVLVLWKSHKWCCKVLKGCVLSRGNSFPLEHWDNCPENGNRQLEVIGNIHDNPELLKEGAE